MPNRILRDGINDSKAVAMLSDSGEILYRRLMSIVDDYGRCEADPEIIRARCFPRMMDRWPIERIAEALTECNLVRGSDTLPLVILYRVGPKDYLQISNFGQRIRSDSKYPAPSVRAAVGDPLTRVSTPLTEDSTVLPQVRTPPTPAAHARGRTESESESYAEAEAQSETESVEHESVRVLPKPPRAADLDGQTSERFQEFWDRYPRKQRKDLACSEFISKVTVISEGATFACLERYLASDEVTRGIVANPDKWLYEQHRGNWEGEWPPARAPTRKESREAKKTVIEEAKELGSDLQQRIADYEQQRRVQPRH